MILGSYKSGLNKIYHYENSSYNLKFSYAGINSTGKYIDINYDGTVAAFVKMDTIENGYQINIVECPVNQENWTSIGVINDLSNGLSLSKDGYTILGSKKGSKAEVWIYSDQENSVWTKKGNTITSPSGAGSNYFENTNAISKDGNIIILADSYYQNRGRILIYYYNTSTNQWEKIKEFLGGSDNNHVFGYNINGNNDLSRIIIGGLAYGSRGTLTVYKTDFYE